MGTPKLSSARFKCLRCKSGLDLTGQYAQAIAESGMCPVCNYHGMVTMTSMRVVVGRS